ncbi:MAG TPA: biotin synthase [Rubrivivax sp.]|nr:biotin synthase [Burkholderiales bacterium]HNU11825.1 biotin synthase [Rubrivivax sp.]
MQSEQRDDDAQGPRIDRAALTRVAARLCAAGAPPWLHGEAARRMAERLTLIRLRPDPVLDWSGPLGASQAVLRAAYPQARQIVVRFEGLPATAEAPARRRRWPWFGRDDHPASIDEADVEAGQAGLVWSNMLLHASGDPLALLGRWQRALAIDGFVMFSMLGPGSLPELRELYRERRWGEPMLPFVDMHDIGDMLVHSGFADPVMDQETLTLTWPDAASLLRELRTLGANVSPHRYQGLRTPRWRERLLAALAGFASEAGRPQLSFELVYGHAFKAAPREPVRLSRRKD